MSRSYSDLQELARTIVKTRSPDATKEERDEKVWMFIQGYIQGMQDYFDHGRKKL